MGLPATLWNGAVAATAFGVWALQLQPRFAAPLLPTIAAYGQRAVPGGAVADATKSNVDFGPPLSPAGRERGWGREWAKHRHPGAMAPIATFVEPALISAVSIAACGAGLPIGQPLRAKNKQHFFE